VRGARTLLAQESVSEGYLPEMDPVMDSKGNVWAEYTSFDGGKDQFYYEVTTKGAGQRYSYAIPHQGTLNLQGAGFGLVPPVVTAHTTLWAEEELPNPGALLKVTIG
jgi:hypothetical protein